MTIVKENDVGKWEFSHTTDQNINGYDFLQAIVYI